MYTASCLCGAVELHLLVDQLNPINVCHCKQCQKAQGGGFAAIIQIELKKLKIVKGQHSLKSYFATEDKKRVFCENCGSPIYSARINLPDIVRLRVGLINEDIDVDICSHAYVNNKAKWDRICDNAIQYGDAML